MPATVYALLLVAAFVAAADASTNEGRVSGTVTNAVTHKPIPLAFVSVAGSKLPPVASDEEDGFFITYELTAGMHTLRVTHEGYQPAEVPVAIQAGKILKVQVELSPLTRKTRFLISVVSEKVPVAGVVRLRGPVEREISVAADGEGVAIVEVPPGRYCVSVTAQGYLAQTREAQIPEGTEQSLVFDLRPEPRKRSVAIKGNKIELRRGIQFASGLAVLLPDSCPILEELVDAIVRNDVQRMRVEGHTDNGGNRARNLRLSEERARAVANYLAKLGIDVDRIETKGFGDLRPVVPNVTRHGRELNRRVELYILERAK